MEAVMAPYNKVFKNLQNEVKQSKIACFFTKSFALFIIWSLWQLYIRNTVSIYVPLYQIAHIHILVITTITSHFIWFVLLSKLDALQYPDIIIFPSQLNGGMILGTFVKHIDLFC